MDVIGAKKLPYICHTMDEICRISKDLENKRGLADTGSCFAHGKMVGDPIVAKRKGTPQAHKDVNKKQHCLNCNLKGHTKKNCLTVKVGELDFSEDDIYVDFGLDDCLDPDPR